MSKKHRKNGARTKKATSAYKRKLEAQRAASASVRGAGSPQKTKERKGSRVRTVIICSLAAVIFAALVFCAAAMLALTSRITVEVGEAPDISRLDGPLGSMICTYHDSADSVDTSEIAERRLGCEFYGFIRRDIVVSVRDTVSPELLTRSVVAGLGEELVAEDFVVLCEDRTDVILSVSGNIPSTGAAGEHTVIVCATDEGGNTTQKSATLTVLGERVVVDIEYGTTAREAAAICAERISHPVSYRDIDVSECADSRIVVTDDGVAYVFTLSVCDTTPPTAKVSSIDAALGASIRASDLVYEIDDESSVEAFFEETMIFSEAESYDCTVILTDEWGNSSKYSATVELHDIKTEITVEAGSTEEEIELLVLGEPTDDEPDERTLSLDFGDSFNTGALGEQTILALGEYSAIPITLTVVDTVPPELTLRDSVAFIGQKVLPELLVSECKDATEVTLSFESEPRTDDEDAFLVTVIAEDAAGNRAEASANLIVTVDEEPPVIYGTSTVYSNVGETVSVSSFSEGVYAVDNADGIVEVTVDSSRVDMSTAGTYFVYYSARDKSGNVGYATSAVIVDPITRDTVDSLADGILSRILTDGMTERERARAIYDWCRTNIAYSARTGYLIGRFVDGAYYGLHARSGNCYVYYSVAATMLTRAGFENIEIKRNSETNPHYWNLVKIDGAWYHLDTCPHYKEYPLESFLLTDSEMRDYSENECIGYYDFDASLYPSTP